MNCSMLQSASLRERQVMKNWCLKINNRLSSTYRHLAAFSSPCPVSPPLIGWEFITTNKNRIVSNKNPLHSQFKSPFHLPLQAIKSKCTKESLGILLTESGEHGRKKKKIIIQTRDLEAWFFKILFVLINWSKQRLKYIVFHHVIKS